MTARKFSHSRVGLPKGFPFLFHQVRGVAPVYLIKVTNAVFPQY